MTNRNLSATLIILFIIIASYTGVSSQTSGSDKVIWIVKPEFDEVKYTSVDDLSQVSVDKKYGIINSEGNVFVKPQFDIMWDFSEGIAMVGIGKIEKKNYTEKFIGKYGFIDTTGKI